MTFGRLVRMSWALGVLGCAGAESSRNGQSNTGAEAGARGDAGAAGGVETAGGAPASDTCPTFGTIADPPGAQLVGTCKTAGSECIPENSPVICPAEDEGPGYLISWSCACDGSRWSCRPTPLTKGGCTYTIACDYVMPEPAPAMSRSGAFYGLCRAGAADCSASTYEVCDDGSQGRTIDWACTCDADGKWACSSTLLDDRRCP